MKIRLLITSILIILFCTGFRPYTPLPSEIPSITLNQYLERNNPYYNIPLSNELQDFIKNQAEYHEMSYELVLAVMETESQFDSDIISVTNDYGLTQINEINFMELETVFGKMNFLDPYDNIVGGIYLLKMAYNKCDGDLHKTLMTYNMGFNGAKKYWDKGVYESDYSRKVVNTYEAYRNGTKGSRGQP